MKSLLYTIYVFVGSEFDGTVIKNNFLEQKLKLYYAEEKKKTLERQEDNVVYFLDKILKPRLPEDIRNSKVEVEFGGNWVSFNTGVEKLEITVDSRNKLAYSLSEVD